MVGKHLGVSLGSWETFWGITRQLGNVWGYHLAVGKRLEVYLGGLEMFGDITQWLGNI